MIITKKIQRSLYVLLIIVVIFLLVYISQANISFRRYGLESGIIEYKITGIQSGKATVYFDRWGAREAKYASVEVFSPAGVQRVNTLTILDGDWIYMIDLDKRIGTKKKNVLLKQALEVSDTKDCDSIGEAMMAKMGAEKIEQENILGRPCDVWEIKNTGEKSWLWRWVPLKSQARMSGGSAVTVAQKVTEGAEIPDEKFAIPKKIYFIDGDISTILLSYNIFNKRKTLQCQIPKSKCQINDKIQISHVL